MSFFRKIFGLGPKDPVNVRQREKSIPLKKEIKRETDLDIDFSLDKVYPILVSENMTEEFSLDGDLVVVFHDRENIFSRVVVSYFFFGELDDKDGTADAFQIRTYDKTDEECDDIFKKASENFENFDIPFVEWNLSDSPKLNFKILSCRVSYFSSQKIMSKKHMMEAHEKLEAEELLVTIPRRGLIFACDKNLSEEDFQHFLNIHAGIVMQDNNELEYLCEDIFVLKEGEVIGVMKTNQLTDILNEKYG